MGNDGVTRLNACPRLLAVSGKMASGKDTLAGMLTNGAWRGSNVIRMAFADSLRDEVNKMLDLVRLRTREGAPNNDVDSELAEVMGCSLDEASTMTGILRDELDANPNAEAHQHDNGLRSALQYWGTDVRRAQNPDYWAEATRKTIMGALTGTDAIIIITDLRFPNEAAVVKQCGGLLVRLDVSPGTQYERLRLRDGITHIDVSKQAHASETALDDYDGFDIRVDTDTVTVDELAGVIMEAMPC